MRQQSAVKSAVVHLRHKVGTLKDKLRRMSKVPKN